MSGKEQKALLKAAEEMEAAFAALIKEMPAEGDIRRQVQSVRKIAKEMAKMGKDAKAMD